MANPSFRDENGANEYVWERVPSLPSDRSSFNYPVAEQVFPIEHERNGVIYARLVEIVKGIWRFGWKNISESMIDSLAFFYETAYFRYYPDSSIAEYFEVFITGTFRPRFQRGGTYDLNIILGEYGNGLVS